MLVLSRDYEKAETCEAYGGNGVIFKDGKQGLAKPGGKGLHFSIEKERGCLVLFNTQHQNLKTI